MILIVGVFLYIIIQQLLEILELLDIFYVQKVLHRNFRMTGETYLASLAEKAVKIKVECNVSAGEAHLVVISHKLFHSADIVTIYIARYTGVIPFHGSLINKLHTRLNMEGRIVYITYSSLK